LLARSAVLAIRAPPFKVLFATTLMEDAPRFFNLHRFRYYLGPVRGTIYIDGSILGRDHRLNANAATEKKLIACNV